MKTDRVSLQDLTLSSSSPGSESGYVTLAPKTMTLLDKCQNVKNSSLYTGWNIS